MLADNGKTIDELKSMAREETSKVKFPIPTTTTTTPQTTHLPPPVEKLTNFMDVREPGILSLVLCFWFFRKEYN